MLPFSGLSLSLFVCLSVSHVRTLCSNGRRNRHHFFCIRQPHVSPRSLYNLTYIGQPLPLQILSQSDPRPVHLSVADIRWQIAAEWLEIVQWSQWRSYRKLLSLFWMVDLLSLTPTTSPSPKWGSKMHPRTNFATRAATWQIWLKIWTRAMSPFAKLIWPFFSYDKFYIYTTEYFCLTHTLPPFMENK